MIRILAACCLALALAAAERIPADSRWFVSCDAQALAATKAGAWIRSWLSRDEAADGLAQLESATGFDPRRDLRRIELCAAADGDATGLLLLRGSFDAQRIGSAIQYAQDYAAVAADGRTIHSWTDKGQRAAGCLAAPDLLLLGRSAERVREGLAAIDAGAAPPIALPPDWEGSALAVAAADGIDQLAAGNPRLAMVRGLRSIAARITGGDQSLVLEVRAVAVGDAEAKQLADLAIGGRAVLALMPPAELDPGLARALAAATLARNGAQLDLRLELPLADALRLAGKAAGQPAGHEQGAAGF